MLAVLGLALDLMLNDDHGIWPLSRSWLAPAKTM